MVVILKISVQQFSELIAWYVKKSQTVLQGPSLSSLSSHSPSPLIPAAGFPPWWAMPGLRRRVEGKINLTTSETRFNSLNH